MPYKLPSELEPSEVQCIKVYVPNDDEWRSLFWGAFSELARWFNYEMDGTENGAKVAKLWRTLYLQSETEFHAGGGCGMFDVRVKPDDTCILQKTTDGETWEDWADLEECGVQLRVAPDGSLEWFDPASETWKPVLTGGASDDYDPLHDDPVQEPYPDPDPDPETGTKCIAAANAALGLKEIIDRLDTAYFEGNLVIWLEVTIVLWALKLVKWITTLIMNMTQATTAYTYEEFHSDYLEFDWDVLREELHCFYDENGVMSEAMWNDLITRLGELEGTSLIWLFLKLIVQGVGSVGMTNGATHRYVTTAECENCDVVEWCFDYTPENLLSTWTQAPHPFSGSLRGIYSGGMWNTEYEDAGNELLNILSPEIPENVRITSVLIEANVAIGYPYHVLQHSKSSDWSVSGESWQDLEAEVWETREAIFEAIDTRGINVFLRQQQHVPVGKIRRIKLCGYEV